MRTVNKFHAESPVGFSFTLILLLIACVYMLLEVVVPASRSTTPTVTVTHVECFKTLGEDICLLDLEGQGRVGVSPSELPKYLPYLTEDQAEICTGGYCYDTHHEIIGLQITTVETLP